ncbi:MAG: VUT family protein [Rhodospirillales bacterium]|nr:VUT family protein [Rhodospirillales bacterium]
MKFKYTALYIVLIVAVNYGFSVVPLVELPGGDKWPPLTLVVGLIFVLRDFAQREIGHSVILAMLAAAAISYFMADPFVALASLAAFLVSEFCDWAVYSFTKKPFAQRVLLSSALGTPIDSIIFLSMIGIASVQGVIVMTISKMLGALVVWYMIKNRMSAAAV